MMPCEGIHYDYDDDDYEDDYDYRYYDNYDYYEYKMLCYELETIKFCAPPIEGTEDIIPITSAYELYEEQKEMGNSVYSYLQEILDGSYYAYKVLYQKRFTTILVIINDGVYIKDIRSFSETRFTTSCYMYLTEWIKEHFVLKNNARTI